MGGCAAVRANPEKKVVPARIDAGGWGESREIRVWAGFA